MENLELKNHLDSVFNELLQLFPQAFHDDLYKNMYFAGGCIVNFLLGKPIVDYDMFIKSADVRDSFKTYMQEVTLLEVIANTQNAVTFRLNSGAIVQVVTRFTGETDRIFASFDFEHCKSFYDIAQGTFGYNADLIADMKLVYTGEKDEFTLNTLKRLCKFVSRGWTPDNQSIINLHRAIQNRPHIDNAEERQMQTIGFYGSSFK